MSKYLRLLNDVVNIKPRNKKDVAIAYIGSEFFQKTKINRLIKLHNEFEINIAGTSKNVTVHLYNGNNPSVKYLSSYLAHHISKDIFGCYVHGSMGTYDNINYSDFDALIILKDEVFEDKKRLRHALKHLLISQKFFFEFDPLQHHGWFVMSEKNLKNYPLLFFPPELFSFAKSLFDNGTDFIINYNSAVDFRKPLFNLISAIERSLRKDLSSYNMFQLKSLLSEFMLIPAFYMQAKTNSGIYKKLSFIEASKDFAEQEWKVMNDVSAIRNVWIVDLKEDERLKLSGIGYKNRKYAKENSPKLNNSFKKLFNKTLVEDMNRFLKLVSDKANEI